MASVGGLQAGFDKLRRKLHGIQQRLARQRPALLLDVKQAEVVMHLGIAGRQRSGLEQGLFGRRELTRVAASDAEVVPPRMNPRLDVYQTLERPCSLRVCTKLLLRHAEQSEEPFVVRLGDGSLRRQREHAPGIARIPCGSHGFDDRGDRNGHVKSVLQRWHHFNGRKKGAACTAPLSGSNAARTKA